MEIWNDVILDSLCRYIGQTVTIFTTSGGLSGSGFTGVLISADSRVIRLICDIGAPPACPIGSACTNVFSPRGVVSGDGDFVGNPLGSVAVIPTCAIAAFTHHAI